MHPMRADSSLKTYRSKRKFTVTPEPRGHVGRGEGHQFVIQKHAARRLHYDLRLELGGVMKSWAVTRGPSLVPGEKRLAVQVEDHPIEYNTFEGTIPQGEYGGGTVLIWDRGRWFPEGVPVRGLEKGHLDFILEGEKLHGRWHFVRMRRGPRETKDNWLLIKAHDEWERSLDDPDILEEEHAIGGERPLDRGDCPRQRQDSGLALEPQRRGKRERGARDASKRGGRSLTISRFAFGGGNAEDCQ